MTETDNADFPHLITDIAITPALESDMFALAAIRERQQVLDALPSERYVDSGYVSGGNAIASEKLGEDLIGPIRDTSTPQSRMPDGFTHDDFRIDFEAGTVTCPKEQVTTIKRSGKIVCDNRSVYQSGQRGQSRGPSSSGTKTIISAYVYKNGRDESRVCIAMERIEHTRHRIDRHRDGGRNPTLTIPVLIANVGLLYLLLRLR